MSAALNTQAQATLAPATRPMLASHTDKVLNITPAISAETRKGLYVLGVAADGRAVQAVFAGNSAIRAEMEEAGYHYMTLPSDEEGFDLSGWVQACTHIALPKPPTPIIKMIQVLSDTQPKRGKAKTYTVGVCINDGGKWTTHGCTCEAGAQGNPCKHLYRAQAIASRAFETARENLMARTPGMTTEAFNKHFQKRALEAGMNGAISMVISAGLGANHPLANLPANPTTPHHQLNKYLKKQASKALATPAPTVAENPVAENPAT